MRRWLHVLTVAGLLLAYGPAVRAEDAATPAPSAPAGIIDPADRAIVAAFRAHARSEAARLTAEHFQAVAEPEMIGWVELKQMAMSLVAYELSGDVEHVRDFARTLENLRSVLRKGPDGLLGWRGRPIKPLLDPARSDAEVDEIQTTFRAVAVIGRFVEIVDAEARLKQEFGPLREPLVDLLENHLVK
jgi:hypothetical protein